ncbi:MAG: leucine-rich repeat domain-containing protein [Candidatus Heimdallarchaeota archaeon]|nr:MAG: leucine-rich repeat domain-containing protein [Candidatus Heimdallarchaeota archaeon]
MSLLLLDLNHNQLVSLPKEILELKNLQYLDLSNNMPLKEFVRESGSPHNEEKGYLAVQTFLQEFLSKE